MDRSRARLQKLTTHLLLWVSALSRRGRGSRLFWLGLQLTLFAAGLFFTLRLLSQTHGLVPPLGHFLEPHTGIWRRVWSPFETAQSDGSVQLLKGLKGSVRIEVDTDQIKHVFAESDEDLYFAQGWLLASERLWQMEFLTRVASGRLAEVFGQKAVAYDKYFRKLGLPLAAKESAELMLSDPVTGPAVRAYASGVNAYIDAMTPSRAPFEYKLLGFMPERWEPARVALLLKFMAYQLAGHSYDLPLTRSRSVLSAADFNELFPLNMNVPEPIVPRATKWNFEAHPPERPKTEFMPNLAPLEVLPQPNPANGSNNWAITGKKSTTGLPILSNDIHLSLGLPALWYEIQLTSPTQSVYGIALPGAPGVILGFNRKVAWGVTNGGTDVLDWYQLRYRDERRSEYLYNGDWRPVIARESEILVRGQPSITLLQRTTHFGPIVYDAGEEPISPMVPRGLAMRWGALEASNELRTFLLLNRAASTEDCRKALDGYQTPDQNFLCADNQNDVGLWHYGKYPIRFAGQGRMISDGSSSDGDWKGWIPPTDTPFVRNPARGFVSSANQAPTDELYPFYLGWPFEAPYRALRINELLVSLIAEKKKLSSQDLIGMQGDTLSWPARALLPSLLKLVRADVHPQGPSAVSVLSQWDYRFEPDSVGATLYYVWYDRLRTRLWSPHFPDDEHFMYPPAIKTLSLLTGPPDSRWFDNPRTPERETLADMATAALGEALNEIESRRGDDITKWAWGAYRPTEFPSSVRIPGLEGAKINARGMESNVFANSGDHGPVWKLVVELGKKPKAFGIYPGGQSGDPTSRFYDNFIEDWAANRLKALTFLERADEANPRHYMQMQLKPAARAAGETTR